MAVMTKSQNLSVDHTGGLRLDSQPENLGQAYSRFDFIAQGVQDENVFDTGLRVTGTSWSPVNSGDFVRPSAASGKGTPVVTFNTAAGTHNGYLHVWGEHGQNAAPTTSTVEPDAYRSGIAAGGPMDGAGRSQVLKRIRLRFEGSPSNGDTFDTGLQSIQLIGAAFSDTSLYCFTQSAGVITLHINSGSPSAVACAIWHRGY